MPKLNFIFATGSKNALNIKASERRYFIIPNKENKTHGSKEKSQKENQ